MTAVILAGGDGLRLRPLTCSLPKAMLSICNKPLIEYNFSALMRHGIKNIIISADRFSKSVADYFDDGRADIPKLSFSGSPLGTSAALKKAVTEWDIPDDESVLVINGSAFADFNYSEILHAHKCSCAVLTVILKKSRRPYDYAVAVEEDGILKDIAFCQPKESCVSDMVLTGSFVINARLAAHISDYGEDIFRDALPAMLKSGIKIGTYTEQGSFSYLRTPADLLRANRQMLTDGENCIGSNCSVDENTVIESSVIGDNVTVGAGCRIFGSVIGDGAYISGRCTVNHAVIGNAAKLSEGASVFEGAVVGGGAVIEESAVIGAGVKIWNGRQVEAFANVTSDIKYGFARPVVINDEGITGETNGIITPQTAAVIGSAAVSVGGRVIIGCRETSAAYALSMAAVSGIMAAGGEAWFIGDASEPELAYCVRLCGGNAGLYIDAGITAKIKFFSSDGLPFTRREEKLIEAGINRGEYRRSGFAHFGKMQSCGEIRELYRTYLMKMRPPKLEKTKVIVNAAGKRLSDICGLLLKNVSRDDGEPLVFHISSDGSRVSAYTDETGYIFHDRLILLCCKYRFIQGKDAALPFDFPAAADELAEHYGRKLYRYSGCSADNEDALARSAAADSDFVYDGIVLMLSVLRILAAEKLTLKKACEPLPSFAAVNRFIALDRQEWHHMNILKELCSERQVCNDGVIINDKRGRVLIRPVKTGKGVMMHVESYAVEAASELCDFYQDALSRLSKKRQK